MISVQLINQDKILDLLGTEKKTRNISNENFKSLLLSLAVAKDINLVGIFLASQ